MTLYRLVSDYGYGDKNWVVEGVTEEEVIEAYKDYLYLDDDAEVTLYDCMENHPPHCYVEEHYPGDEPDWDFMSS